MSSRVVVLVGSEFEENLSLRYLAAAVEADGFRAEFVAANETLEAGGGGAAAAALIDEILGHDPIVVGLSVPFQMRAPELLGLATGLRRAGYAGHICVGGQFPTFEYANILSHFPAVDSVCRHEGENTLREICRRVAEAIEVADIAGLVVRDDAGAAVIGSKRPLAPLDDLPFPDRRGEPHDILGVPSAPIIGTRGCYADCSFCSIFAYAESAKGKRYRMREPEHIVREMKEDYERRGTRLFVFHDDNFFLPYLPSNLKRYQEFAALLAKEQMPDVGLVIKCRPNDVDPELFRLLKSIGMVRAYVGIETNSNEGVVSLNRRITPADNLRAVEILRELEVYHSFNVLIFDPEATLEGVEANLDFMGRFADTPFNFCRAEVYAGTPLKEILETQGRLRGDYLAWGYDMREPRVELLFRISMTAFMARNFNSDGIANLNMGMRFDAEVLRRFYPEAWDRAWQDRLVGFSRAVGEDSVAHMREALAFAREVSLGDHASVKAFTLALAREVGRRDLAFLCEVKAIRREMEARIRAVSGRGIHNRFGQGMPVWAAETRRLGSSNGLELSTELLPAPELGR